MLVLNLNLKPLSINDAFRGRHFPTTAKKVYEQLLRFSLPNVAVVGEPYYRVEYDFHLVRFSTTDWDNCVKVLQDCIVKRGIISDDRLIVDARVRKFPAKADRITVKIEGCSMEDFAKTSQTKP